MQISLVAEIYYSIIPLDGNLNTLFNMIKSFKCKYTEKLFLDYKIAKFHAIAKVARMRLISLDIATSLEDLKVPPGNQLEALKGDRKNQYSIRINKQWRVCFSFEQGNAYNVEIIDYH